MTSDPQRINHKKDHDILLWKSDAMPGLEQAHTCDGIKPVNEMTTSHS